MQKPDASFDDVSAERKDDASQRDASQRTRDAEAVEDDEPNEGSPEAGPSTDAKAADGGTTSELSATPDAASPCVPKAETCNGRDDDCDQAIDEDAKEAPIGSTCDNDGAGPCARSGKQVCFKGAVICDAPPPSPQKEECDHVDNDCDGTADNGLTNECGGKVCDADLSGKGEACAVEEADCIGSGKWACDPLKLNNALTCTVSKRTPRNLVGDPGFEEQASFSLTPPWGAPKGAFIVTDAHSGTRGVRVDCNAQTGTTVVGWNNVFQNLAVLPNSTYKLEGWVKTSANLPYGRIGARDATNMYAEIADNLGYAFAALPQWTYVSTRFTTSATTTMVQIYIGGQDDNGTNTTVTVDDVVVTRENACP